MNKVIKQKKASSAVRIKKNLSDSIRQEMAFKRITISGLAKTTRTNRNVIKRVLDKNNTSITLKTMAKAEIEVDPDTFEVRPLKLTAVQEFGRPIHPALAQGQIEGGTAQGLGYALLERVVMRNGAMANSTLTNYTIPTTLDMPELDVVMLENPYPGGPFGAKGLGELPMDGPAPAVVNALRRLGLDVREIPATPELIASCTAIA